MKFYKTHFLAKFYQLFYATDNLPKSFCDFFWALLWAFLLSPFCVVSIIANIIIYKKNNIGSFEDGWKPVTNFFVWWGIFIIGFLSMTFIKMNIGEILLLLGVAILTVIIMIVGFIALVYIAKGIVYVFRLVVPEKEETEEKRKQNIEATATKYFLIEWWKSFKGKYCPRMEWFDTQDEYVKSK